MKVFKFNRQNQRFAPWATPCVLGLFMAILFLVPSVVFATNAVLSQECEYALVNTEHVITATVTGDDGTPAVGVNVLFYIGPAATNANPNTYESTTTDQDGIAEFTSYMGSATGTDLIELWVLPNWDPFLGSISTTWTSNEADLCSGSQKVLVGGRMTLNVKKKGALKIAVCGTDEFKVSNVDLKTVELAGVAPWHSKQKDSRLCPDGKDGFVDLVLKFKNRDVVEALEKDLGKELVDGIKDVPLALTGNLSDGTAFGGEWTVDIKKKGKRHGRNEQYQDFGNSKNGNGKAKGHN